MAVESCGTGWGLNQYLPVDILIRKPCRGYYLRWYYNGWHYWFFLPGATNMITEGENYRTIGTRKITMGSGQLIYSETQAIRTILLTREVYLLTADGWKNIRVDTGSVITYKNQINGYEVEITTTIGSKEISYTTGYSPVPVIPVVDPAVTGCEVVIGSQIWACKNYDVNYPGSKVYNDDESNRAIYGGLYTWAQVVASGFAPPGWHIPSLVEWEQLITAVGGILVAGGNLKDGGFVHWSNPNTGAVDSVDFTALGAGAYSTAFVGLRTVTNFWTTNEASPTNAYAFQLTNTSAGIAAPSIVKTHFNSVRLIKDTLSEELIIGTQTWKAANVADNIAGSRVYDDDEANRAIYGGLYRWTDIVAIEALYPGWHVPTQAEFNILVGFLGVTAGGKMKETGLSHWTTPNTGATNSSGFTGLPGGAYFNAGAVYQDIFNFGLFWSADSVGADGDYWYLSFNNDTFTNGGLWQKIDFYSIRLIKD